MKTAILLALSISLLACDPPLGPSTQTNCYVPTFGYVYSDFKLDCSDVKRDVTLAAELLSGAGLTPGLDGFNARFEGTRLTIYDVPYLFDDSVELTSGNYNSFHGIALTRKADALLHELVHVIEWQDFVLNTGAHPLWKERGYLKLSDDYAAKSYPIESGYATEPQEGLNGVPQKPCATDYP